MASGSDAGAAGAPDLAPGWALRALHKAAAPRPRTFFYLKKVGFWGWRPCDQNGNELRWNVLATQSEEEEELEEEARAARTRTRTRTRAIARRAQFLLARTRARLRREAGLRWMVQQHLQQEATAQQRRLQLAAAASLARRSGISISSEIRYWD